jgi:hypothetical protein
MFKKDEELEMKQLIAQADEEKVEEPKEEAAKDKFEFKNIP